MLFDLVVQVFGELNWASLTFWLKQYGAATPIKEPGYFGAVGPRIAPNKVWVTDITYIRTYEGWLYLAAVMDLYSRQIVGWATRATMTSDLVLQALLAAVWKRKPDPGVMVHSDQGSQFTSDDWQSFLKAHHMVPSMSRRGNCHDNAVAESFFSALKKERIKRRIYPTRAAAASDVFDYIEMFYNPIRRHGSAGDLSPVEFERRYAQSGS